MYGATPTATAGMATLPLTGLMLGSWALLAATLIFAGLALWALIRRHSKNRP